jgi:hypothetical protein
VLTPKIELIFRAGQIYSHQRAGEVIPAQNISHWPDARLFVPLPEKKRGSYRAGNYIRGKYLEIFQIKLHASAPNCGHKFSKLKEQK